MLKFLFIIAIIISIIGIYTIGFDDFIKLLQLVAEKTYEVIANWFIDAKEDLL